MSNKTWLDLMDEIMDLNILVPIDAGDAQTVIKGLSSEIKKADYQLKKSTHSANITYDAFTKQSLVMEAMISTQAAYKNKSLWAKIKIHFS
jgi:hypothetical protein